MGGLYVLQNLLLCKTKSYAEACFLPILCRRCGTLHNCTLQMIVPGECHNVVAGVCAKGQGYESISREDLWWPHAREFLTAAICSP